MRTSGLASALLVLGLAGHSCSNSPTPSATNEGGTSPYAAGCPAAFSPASGGACSPAGRICSYGTHPRAECRDRVTCTGGLWVAREAKCAPPSAAAACPPAVPAADMPCTQNQQLCAYPSGTECVCYAGAMGWVCDTPRPTSGDCPVTAPNAGTTCADAASCTYVCSVLTSSALVARCADDVWTWAFMACANTNP